MVRVMVKVSGNARIHFRTIDHLDYRDGTALKTFTISRDETSVVGVTSIVCGV